MVLFILIIELFIINSLSFDWLFNLFFVKQKGARKADVVVQI